MPRSEVRPPLVPTMSLFRTSLLAAFLLTLTCSPVSAQAGRSAPPSGAMADYHVHIKGDLTLADALRHSRETGIYYGIVINGGLNFPVDSDAGLEAFLREMRGMPAFVAFQAEGREWVRLFGKETLEKFDYVFTDAMTWTDDNGRRMRLWIREEVGTIADPQRFMDMLVDRATRIFETEPIDLYVNPTFIPAQIAADYDRLWTPDRMKKIVRGLVANGIGMEINNRYRIPSAAFIRVARQAGVKFACGTNNTGASDLGRNEYCAQMIRECDLRPEDLWSPPAEGRKAVQRKWNASSRSNGRQRQSLVRGRRAVQDRDTDRSGGRMIPGNGRLPTWRLRGDEGIQSLPLNPP